MKFNFASASERVWSTLAIIVAVVITHFLWMHGKFPAHDTRYAYETFYVFYHSLLEYKELPLWIQQLSFGAPIDSYLITFLPPVQFVVSLFGLIFHITDTLKLFYCSMGMELFILTWGAYWWGREIFKYRASAVLLAIFLLLTTFYFWESQFDLQLYMWIPITAFFFSRFINTRDTRFLFAGFLCFMLSIIGVVPYFVAPMGLVTLIVLLASVCESHLTSQSKDFFQFIAKQFRKHYLINIVLCLIGLVMFISWVLIISHFLDNQQLISAGNRLPNGGVPFEEFVSYGYHSEFIKFLELFFVVPSNIDARFFVGLSALVFLILALIYVRRAMVVVYFITIVVVLALACADATSIPAIMYRIPGMNFYRHIGLLLPIARLFIFVCAAFGFDKILDCMKNNIEPKIIIKSGIRIIGSLLVLMIWLSLHFAKNIPYPANWEGAYIQAYEVHYVNIFILFLLLIVFLRFYRNAYPSNAKSFAIIVIAIVGLELSSYSFFIHHNTKLMLNSTLAKLVKTRSLEFNLWREQDYHSQKIEAFGATYGTHDAFMNINRCFNDNRTDLRIKYLPSLWEALDGKETSTIDSSHDYWSNWLILQNGAISKPSFPDMQKPILQSFFGCVQTELKPVRIQYNGIKSLASDKQENVKHPNIEFEFKDPQAVIGIQMQISISKDKQPDEFELYASHNGNNWQKLFQTKSNSYHYTSSFYSWWFSNLNSYRYYRIDFKRDTYNIKNIQNVRLRTEYPIVQFSSKANIVSSKNEAEKLIKKLNSLNSIYPTVIEDSYHKSRMPAGAHTADNHEAIQKFERSYNKIYMNVEVAYPGKWLILRESWHPAWHAYVDTQKQQIFRADLTFPVIWVPSGKHEIVFEFNGNANFGIKYLMIIICSFIVFLLWLTWLVLDRND